MKARHSLALAAFTVSTFAADPRGDNPGTQPSTPQEELAKFHLPPGFEIQLVAAEPEIQKPINFNFDAAGRLWVTGSELYPWPASTDPNGQPIPDFDKGWRGLVDGFRVGDAAPPPSPVGRDTVRILSDFAPDGHARKITIFADKLNIPSGIQPLPRKPGGWHPQITQIFADGQKPASDPSSNLRKSAKSADQSSVEIRGDSAIVYSIPNIWLLTDVDGDGFAEKREPLYTGFGYTDTHGGSSSYIYWIDGWIYGTHGFRNHSEVRDRLGHVTVVDSGNTYRFRPDGTAFEIYTHGQTNPFGLAFDPLGNLFSADSHSKPVYMLLRGGYYEGIGKQHDGLGFAPRITDDDHGSSAIGGIIYYADDKWPEEYRGNLFNGNPVTQKINRDRLEWHGSTPKAIRMPDFLTSDDPWFRPVFLKLGPDGALYIADFYNPIIGHYEVPLTDPHRDHTHGRIWRVVWRGENASGGGNASAPAAAGASAPAPGGTGGPPVAAGGPPAALRAAQPLLEDARSGLAARDVAGEPPATTGQRPVPPGGSVPLPDLTILDAPALIEKLADPSLEVRRLATNELVDRVDNDAARTALENVYHKGFPDRAAHPELALWVFERLGDHVDVHPIVGGRKAPIAVQAMKILGDHEAILQSEWDRLESAAWSDDQTVARTAAEVLSQHPKAYYLGAIMGVMQKAPAEDSELRYTLRGALRNTLLANGGFKRATEIAAGFPQYGQMLADASLGAPTPDAAAFLLAHLERTRLETPRAGEYLKHVVLYLPAEKLDALVKLIGQVGNAPVARKLELATSLTAAARQRGIALPKGIEAWSRGVVLASLASGDDALIRPSIAAVRDLKLDAKLAPLAAIARDEKRDGALRLAALEAAANLPASRELLVTTFADQRHMIFRKRAAELLAQNGVLAPVLAALPQAPWELALAISAALAKTDAGATALLDAIEAGKAPARVLVNKAVVGGFFARSKSLQDRAKSLAKDLPPEDARLDKVIAERAAAFRKAKPDATHGAQIFQQQCAVCHRFRNAGGNVGPNLDGVVARGPQRLIEDILDPNRNVDPGFRQTIIASKDGQMFAGTNVREQADAITLVDATGKDVSIPKSTIKTRTQTPLSLMPPAFETMIAPGDFNDLLAFLLAVPK